MNEQTTVTPVRSLEARYYIDAAIYQGELRGVLSQTWQYAGHVSQLQNPGDYFAFQIADQDLLPKRPVDIA